MLHQRTLLHPVKFQGIGLHSGNVVTATIKPAKINTGINFKRTDLKTNNIIPALYDNVVDTRLCTVISNDKGIRASTIEHLMAALWGCEIDNALIEIDGEEVPIMDGSSAPFVALIERAGTCAQDTPRKFLKLKEEIVFEDNDKFIKLSPNDHFEVDASIEFDHPKIGLQCYKFSNKTHKFNFEISRARTFGYAKDIEHLKAMGLAKGASLVNAIGLDDENIMNPEGLRYENEFVKHKLLDCIGDLYLAGYRLLAKVKTYKGGHALNNSILKKLFNNSHAFEIVEITTPILKTKFN